MKKTMVVAILASALAWSSPVWAEYTGQDICEKYNKMIVDYQDNFPKVTGSTLRQFQDTAQYNAQSETCDITLSYEVNHDAFVAATIEFFANKRAAKGPEADEDHPEGPEAEARQYLATPDGTKMIKLMAAGLFRADFKRLKDPATRVFINLSFQQDDIEPVLVPAIPTF